MLRIKLVCDSVYFYSLFFFNATDHSVGIKFNVLIQGWLNIYNRPVTIFLVLRPGSGFPKATPDGSCLSLDVHLHSRWAPYASIVNGIITSPYEYSGVDLSSISLMRPFIASKLGLSNAIDGDLKCGPYPPFFVCMQGSNLELDPQHRTPQCSPTIF